MCLKDIPVSGQWPRSVRSAMLHVVSLAHGSITFSRSWAADSSLQRVRLAGELERTRNEVSLLREELRIKDARMVRIPAHHRPFYPPVERMAILELKAARGWNLVQTAKAFQVEPETIASWSRRLEEEGNDALVQLPEQMNKFPAFVRHAVYRLKILCPTMGKKRIAQILVRAGLHLSTTSVARFLKEPPASPDQNPPLPIPQVSDLSPHPSRVVTARHPNHVWHVDLTTVPTSAGFWTSLFPFALPQVWPFCWWVALVVDHFSRKCVGFAVFKKQPTSLEVRSFIGRAIRGAKMSPRHLISDRGGQFDCKDFRKWAKRKKIRLRYGAVGRYGSIAIIERFIRSLKSECTRQVIVPFRLMDFRKELSCYVGWYNEFRPHQGLDGRTPQEVYDGADPPDIGTEMLELNTKVAKNAKRKILHNAELSPLELHVSHFKGKRHLPIVQLRKAA